jgi:hypothetical protein
MAFSGKVQSKVHAVDTAEPIRRAPADIGLVSFAYC